MSSKISNINDYTLIETGDVVSNIYFYPHYAMIKEKVRSKKNQICLLFEIHKERESHLYTLYTYLLNKEGEKIFHSYSLYLKEIDKYKYILLKSKNDANHAEVIKKEIIDFNTLDYSNFLTILSNNKELSKMIPDLKEALSEKAESLVEEKRQAKYIDIPSLNNYYNNIIGYLVDDIEKQVTTEDEIETTRNILKNIKSNFNVVLHNKYQTNLAYIATIASIINHIKSNLIKPDNILEAKDLKTDTNKLSINIKDLNYILNSFLNNLKDEPVNINDLNIVQERIEYILTSKSRLKCVTNFIKVILIDDKYTDSTKRNRSINEYELKELILSSFTKHTYRPLPRNQVLFYNEEDNNVDFIAIISLDLVLNLLRTYKLNTNEEYYHHIEIINTVENIVIKNNQLNNKNTLHLNILTLLHMLIYNYKNINQNALLFDKGLYILSLDYNNGAYDIKIISHDSDKKYGKVCKLNKDTNELVRKALNKSEKQFNSILNKIIYKSLEESLNTLQYNINLNYISNQDITVSILKPYKEDFFECTFTLGELLLLITSLKGKKEKQPKKEEPENIIVEESEDNIKEEQSIEETKSLSIEEREYIIRKSNTIFQIMNTNPLDNENYQKVAELYKKFINSSKEEQEEILLQLKDLL